MLTMEACATHNQSQALSLFEVFMLSYAKLLIVVGYIYIPSTFSSRSC